MHCLPLCLSLTHILPLSHTHTHTQSPSLSLSHTHTLHCLFPYLLRVHTLQLSKPNLSLSHLGVTHINTGVRACAHTHTHKRKVFTTAEFRNYTQSLWPAHIQSFSIGMENQSLSRHGKSINNKVMEFCPFNLLDSFSENVTTNLSPGWCACACVCLSVCVCLCCFYMGRKWRWSLPFNCPVTAYIFCAIPSQTPSAKHSTLDLI